MTLTAAPPRVGSQPPALAYQERTGAPPADQKVRPALNDATDKQDAARPSRGHLGLS